MTSPYDDLDRPPLDSDALTHAVVRPDGLWRSVTVVDETASTNADLADLARAGAAEGLVLVAESQTGGRGRLGRTWTAPPRSGVTVSVLLRPPVPAVSWPWLPLLTGLAVAEAVRRVGDLPAELKWPNDVLVNDRKLAGVLLERVETTSGPAAIVGVGINVSLRDDERPVPEATSLALEGVAAPDRTVVLREVLRVLEQLYAAWVAGGGDAGSGLAESYARRCSTVGRQVRIDVPTGSAVVGMAVRVDDDGRLVVATSAGEVAVGAGDVVHVR